MGLGSCHAGGMADRVEVCRLSPADGSAPGQPSTRWSCVSPPPIPPGLIRSKPTSGLCQFTIANSNHPNHTVQTRRLQAYLRWRNDHARSLEVLDAQRCERTRIRSEKDTAGDDTTPFTPLEDPHQHSQPQHQIPLALVPTKSFP